MKTIGYVSWPRLKSAHDTFRFVEHLQRQAMQQANDYGRWLKAETDATLARVASGAATIYTQAEFDQRSAKRRVAIARRRNEVGA